MLSKPFFTRFLPVTIILLVIVIPSPAFAQAARSVVVKGATLRVEGRHTFTVRTNARDVAWTVAAKRPTKRRGRAQRAAMSSRRGADPRPSI